MSDIEDDTETTGEPVFKPSFVLIAIDTSPLMFIKNEVDKSTPFHNCIKACYYLANSLIFTQNKRSWSPFGVVLAREDASASFVNFEDNILNSIKFLKEKANTSGDDLENLYQRKGSLDLSAFFLLCKKKFKEVKSVFFKRTIIYLTNDDNPTGGDQKQRFAALNEAKNFEANGITFEIVTMRPDFDYKLFYNELFSLVKTPLVETLVEDEDGLQEKLSSLILKRFYQRKLYFYPFVGDQNRFLKVVQKSFIGEERFYNNAHVSKEGKTLKKIVKDNQVEVKKYVLKCESEHFEFDLEEYMEINKTDLPIGYTLFCVTNRVTEVGSIIIDNVVLENDSKEELPYFTSFWQYCVDKNKVLVCLRKLRQNDKIRFVEFIPKFANNTRIFVIKGIPFEDENNYVDSDLATEVEMKYLAEQIKVTNELIDRLSFDYHPKIFSDPVAEKKKAFLRSKLLEEPKEDVEDVTLDNAGIDKALGEVGDKFKRLLGLVEQQKGPQKRKPAAGGRAAASKKKK